MYKLFVFNTFTMKEVTIGIVLFLGVITFLMSFNIVKEGNVGIYYQFGKLIPLYVYPGFHFKSPFSSSAEVTVRQQIDGIPNVHCNTSDGMSLSFENIEIGNILAEDKVIAMIRLHGEDYDNYLIKTKVRHQIKEMCSKLTLEEVAFSKFALLEDILLSFLQNNDETIKTGLVIKFVRLTKPTLPPKMKEQYEKLAEEKLATQVAIQTQQRLKTEEETKKALALSQEETKRAITLSQEELKQKHNITEEEMKQATILLREETLLKINLTQAEMARKLAETKAQMQYEELKAQEAREIIENRMLEAKHKAMADAEKYKVDQETENYKQLLSIPGYLDMKKAEMISKNSKMFFGDVPKNMFTNEQECGKIETPMIEPTKGETKQDQKSYVYVSPSKSTKSTQKEHQEVW